MRVLYCVSLNDFPQGAIFLMIWLRCQIPEICLSMLSLINFCSLCIQQRHTGHIETFRFPFRFQVCHLRTPALRFLFRLLPCHLSSSLGGSHVQPKFESVNFRYPGIDSAQRLPSSSFSVMICLLLRDHDLLSRKELHLSLWVDGTVLAGFAWGASASLARNTAPTIPGRPKYQIVG